MVPLWREVATLTSGTLFISDDGLTRLAFPRGASIVGYYLVALLGVL